MNRRLLKIDQEPNSTYQDLISDHKPEKLSDIFEDVRSVKFRRKLVQKSRILRLDKVLPQLNDTTMTHDEYE